MRRSGRASSNASMSAGRAVGMSAAMTIRASAPRSTRVRAAWPSAWLTPRTRGRSSIVSAPRAEARGGGREGADPALQQGGGEPAALVRREEGGKPALRLIEPLYGDDGGDHRATLRRPAGRRGRGRPSSPSRPLSYR